MSEKTNPFLQPGNQFLAKYLSGLGAKPGKMSVAGIGLPEFGFSEKVVPTLFSNRNEYNKEVAKKNEELNKKGSLYGSNFGSAITSTIASLPQAPGKLVDKAKDFLDRPEISTTENKLGSPFDENKFYRNLRGMQVTDSILRDYEMGREKARNLDMFKQTMPLIDIAAETAAQRRLMEDRSSPTKISQQILRARQGEAALMNATANQLQTAALASAQGIAPRGRAGGR